jgi:DNA-binding CsgD family transcriptional regulator
MSVPRGLRTRRLTDTADTTMLHITPMERSALQLLANGKATRDIAERWGVSEPEVDAQLHVLFERLGAAGRSEAVAAALRRGLLKPAAIINA